MDSDSDHINICKVSAESNLYKACKSLLEEIMRTAPQKIAEASRPCKYSPMLSKTRRRYAERDNRHRTFCSER